MAPNKEIEITDKVKSLYEVMQEEKVEELEIKSPEFNVHIKRKNNSKPQQFKPAKIEEFSIQKNNDGGFIQAAEPSVSGDTIKSPITGVFYRSPSPTSPMFVNEGDVIDTGKTLCIIEAMKVMNEIKATEKVRIVKILAENGKSISSDQDLFSIEKL
ncbi:MAG: biotin/lipoyl-containing protein [Endomicrobiaceae bacterium]